MFSIIIWSLWKERNSQIFNNKACSIYQLQDLILTRLSWWIKGWGASFPYSVDEIIRHPYCLDWNELSSSVGTEALVKPSFLWSPPTSYSLKWNVDASVNASQSMSAIGGVLRNSQGWFMCMFSSPIPPIEINSAEVLAISEQFKYL